MNKLSTRRILMIAAAIIIMAVLAFNLPLLWQVLTRVFSVIEPVIIGACIAFILNLLTNLFEKKVFAFISTPAKPRRKIVRTLSIISTLVVVAAIVALILLVIVPQIISTTRSIIAGFPAFADRAIEFVSEMMERFGVSPQNIKEFVLGGEAFFDKLVTFANTNLNAVVKSIVSFGGGVISFTADAVFGIFIAIYFLAEKERVLSQCCRFARAVLKPDVYRGVTHIGSLANKSFSNFISGQLMEALILALLCFVGMLIFGFPYAPVVAVLIGVCALVPIVGAWIGGGVSALLILTNSPIEALWFLVFYIVLQQIEGNFIYPRVVGRQVGLPGIWVLISVVVGSGLFGALGALIAVPVTAVLYALAAEYVSNFEKKEKKQYDRPLE